MEVAVCPMRFEQSLAEIMRSCIYFFAHCQAEVEIRLRVYRLSIARSVIGCLSSRCVLQLLHCLAPIVIQAVELATAEN